jgi:peptide/nickel transport system ATP-binding protein
VGDALLKITDLHVHFRVPAGVLGHDVLRAVDGVSLEIGTGETLGLVGESGSGKSSIARAVARIDRVTSGEIWIDRCENGGGKRGDRSLRRNVQMIFQDARGSLNPRHTVAEMVREPLDVHDIGPPAGRDARAGELLELVGLDAGLRTRYPRSLSGGQAQRVAIARALAVGPRLLMCDEPTSALDVSVQAQVVNLLARLQDEFDIGYLFISHDLAVVRHLSDSVAVMYLGAILETGPSDELFGAPRHPYTRALIDAVPEARAAEDDRITLKGDAPSPLNVPLGCRFQTRCPWAQARCFEERPELRPIAPTNLQAACHFAEEIHAAEH